MMLYPLQTNMDVEIYFFPLCSDYPASTEDSNINMIKTFKEKYDIEVGLSDHTINNTAALAAVTLGAVAIEKHFIHSKQYKGT